jgi:hypothetical protein
MAIAKMACKATASGLDYASLRFLQKYCASDNDNDIGDAKTSFFVIDDPRKYDQLADLKKNWKFSLQHKYQCSLSLINEESAELNNKKSDRSVKNKAIYSFPPEVIEKLVESLRPYSKDDYLSKLYQWSIDEALSKLRDQVPSAQWADTIKNSSDTRFKKTLELRSEMEKSMRNVDANPSELREYIKWIVEVWGKITGGDNETAGGDNETAGGKVNLIKLANQAEESHTKNNGFKFNRIASWSKYLAFKYPNTRAIYDARVIFSLNWFLYEYGSLKYFPAPSGRNTLMSGFDYTIWILMKNIEGSKFRDEISQDIKRRESSPGKKSSAINKLKKGLYIDSTKAYSSYCDLLMAIANKLYDPRDQHALTKVEMILFAIADRDIILKIFDSLRGLKPSVLSG